MQKFVGVDYFNIESLLSEDEKMIRDSVRDFVSAEIIPIIEKYNRDGQFPHQLIEKMADLPQSLPIPTTYSDLSTFNVNSYSLNEILAEKIRTLMQRNKVRDYYDVWRILNENSFDLSLIGKLVLKKCKLNNISYEPSKISDINRLEDLKAHWDKELGRLVKELPNVNKVFSEIKTLTSFLPPN